MRLRRRRFCAVLLVGAATAAAAVPNRPALPTPVGETAGAPGKDRIAELLDRLGEGAETPKAPGPIVFPGQGAAPGAAGPAPAASGLPEQLAAARREAIAAAHAVRKRERALTTVQEELRLLGADAEAGQRGLDESRGEQERLLGILLHLARSRGRESIAAAGPLTDRLRGEMLMQEAEPALRAQARALAREVARVGRLQKQLAATREAEAAARQTLVRSREHLATVVERRNAAAGRIEAQRDSRAAPGPVLEGDAKNLAELVALAETAAERRGKETAPPPRKGQRKAKAPPAEDTDPARPRDLRSLTREVERREAGAGKPEGEPPPLVAPAAASMARQAPNATDAPDGGLKMIALAGAPVVAPFDGRVIYAGPFRDFGLVLIIGHDHLYHSVLAGLGRADVKVGEWILAGEPVGTMPEKSLSRSGAQAEEPGKVNTGRQLYYELRRDGRPVDPRPLLALDENGRNLD